MTLSTPIQYNDLKTTQSNSCTFRSRSSQSTMNKILLTVCSLLAITTCVMSYVLPGERGGVVCAGVDCEMGRPQAVPYNSGVVCAGVDCGFDVDYVRPGAGVVCAGVDCEMGRPQAVPYNSVMIPVPVREQAVVVPVSNQGGIGCDILGDCELIDDGPEFRILG